MICYVCAAKGEERPAVALCPNCQVGLCMRHAVENSQTAGPGGTRLGCWHTSAHSPGRSGRPPGRRGDALPSR